MRAILAAAPVAGCCPPGSNQPSTADVVVDGGLDDAGLELLGESCAQCPPSDAGVVEACWQLDGGGGAGPTRIRCEYFAHFCVGGRRFEGLEDPEQEVAEPGAYFARMAWLEAASVHAFERLAGELAAHGAPGALVARARRAAADEVRHARSLGALARRFGATAPAVEERPLSTRALVEIAAENAAEGVVREAYGALVAAFQSQNAADPAVRRTLRAVALDEARHAELAFDVDAWAKGRLDETDRARVKLVRRESALALARSCAAPVPATLVEIAGLPSPPAARRLVAAATTALWG